MLKVSNIIADDPKSMQWYTNPDIAAQNIKSEYFINPKEIIYIFIQGENPKNTMIKIHNTPRPWSIGL